MRIKRTRTARALRGLADLASIAASLIRLFLALWDHWRSHAMV